MKIPERAPDLVALVNNGLTPDLEHISIASRCNEEYYHWDDLKYRDLDVDRNRLWLMMKMMRATAKIIRIGGTCFSYNLTNKMNQMLHEMDLHLSNGFMPSGYSTDNDRLLSTTGSLMEESIASSQMEGASTTTKAAKIMLRRGTSPKDRSQLMIKNNYQAMQFIKTVTDRELTPELIKEIHRVISEGLMEQPEEEGRFRTDDSIAVRDAYEDITYYQPVEASRIDQCISDLCRFANDESSFIHPLVKGIILHFLLAYIHPFMDGNGRVARSLFYWYVLKKQYRIVEFLSISKVIKQHRGRYDRAYLLVETDDNDLTYFLKYNLEMVSESYSVFSKYLDRKLKEQEMMLISGKESGLTLRQNVILRYMIRHNEPMDAYYAAELCQTTLTTARRDLLKLQEMGYVKESGRDGHRKTYVCSESAAR